MVKRVNFVVVCSPLIERGPVGLDAVGRQVGRSIGSVSPPSPAAELQLLNGREHFKRNYRH